MTIPESHLSSVSEKPLLGNLNYKKLPQNAADPTLAASSNRFPLEPNPNPQSIISMEIVDNSTADDNPTHFTQLYYSLKSQFIRAKAWLSSRNKRAANFPPPLKQLFDQLELWKLCAMFGTTIGSIAAFLNLKIISKEFMDVEIILLIISMLLFMIAHTLQDINPDIAAAGLLSGVALLIAMLHLMAFKLLNLPANLLRLVISPFIACYAILFFVVLYKIYKEDVRVKEEDGSGNIDAV